MLVLSVVVSDFPHTSVSHSGTPDADFGGNGGMLRDANGYPQNRDGGGTSWTDPRIVVSAVVSSSVFLLTLFSVCICLQRSKLP